MRHAEACFYRIVRLRAVQEFTPSQALSFVFTIKHILHKELSKYSEEKSVRRFFADVEANTEKLMLVAVDVYGKCRERIYLSRINQAKNSLNKLLIKKEIICEIPDVDPGLPT